MSASSYKKFIGEDIFISELSIPFLWSLEHISSNIGTWSLWVPVTLQTPFTTLEISAAHLCLSSQPHCWPGLQPQAGVPSNTVTCLSCRRYGCMRGLPSKETPKWKYKTYEMCNDGMPPHTVWKIMNCILMFWSPWWYSGEEFAWRCSRHRFDPRSPTFLTPGIGFVADLLHRWEEGMVLVLPTFHHSPPVMWPSSYEATDWSMALGLGTPAIKGISYHLWLQGIPNLVESSNTWNENFSAERDLLRGKQLTTRVAHFFFFYVSIMLSFIKNQHATHFVK